MLVFRTTTHRVPLNISSSSDESGATLSLLFSQRDNDSGREESILPSFDYGNAGEEVEALSAFTQPSQVSVSEGPENKVDALPKPMVPSPIKVEGRVVPASQERDMYTNSSRFHHAQPPVSYANTESAIELSSGGDDDEEKGPLSVAMERVHMTDKQQRVTLTMPYANRLLGEVDNNSELRSLESDEIDFFLACLAPFSSIPSLTLKNGKYKKGAGLPMQRMGNQGFMWFICNTSDGNASDIEHWVAINLIARYGMLKNGDPKFDYMVVYNSLPRKGLSDEEFKERNEPYAQKVHKFAIDHMYKERDPAVASPDTQSQLKQDPLRFEMADNTENYQRDYVSCGWYALHAVARDSLNQVQRTSAGVPDIVFGKDKMESVDDVKAFRKYLVSTYIKPYIKKT